MKTNVIKRFADSGNSSREFSWDDVGKNPVKVANVMATKNYNQFKLIDGNRDVKHAVKIKKSIEAVGLLSCPVLCNENMEIIDGQGRFTACKELNIPVLYVIQRGIGIEEVRKMNSVSSNWKTRDYIHSYAHGGEAKTDYIYFENLKKQYPYYNERIIANAVNGTVGNDQYKKLQDGTFQCDSEKYTKAISVLSYLDNFVGMVKQIGGRADYMYLALMFCHGNPTVDNDYLLTKFKSYYKTLNKLVTVEDALKELQEKIYNYQLRGGRERVYLLEDYDRYRRAQIAHKS